MMCDEVQENPIEAIKRLQQLLSGEIYQLCRDFEESIECHIDRITLDRDILGHIHDIHIRIVLES